MAAARHWRRARRVPRKACTRLRRGKDFSRSAALQRRGARTLLAGRVRRDRLAPRLLSRAARPRGRRRHGVTPAMSRSREEMLEEMGLGPTWRLRAEAAPAPVVHKPRVKADERSTGYSAR